MKILIDLTSLAYNFSGIERYAANIAVQLIGQFTDQRYILVFKDEIPLSFGKFRDKEYIDIVILKGKNRLIFSQIILPFKLYGFKADVYLFMAFPTPFLFFRKNTVSTIHDIGCWDCSDTMKKSSKYFFRILYYRAATLDSYIMTVSDFTKKRIIDKLHVNENNIWVIHSAISENFIKYINTKINHEDKSTIKKKYNLPEQYLLCLSTLEPRKNLRLLVEAYKELKTSNALHLDLVLAGRKGWKIENLFSTIDQQIAEHIHLTGFINDDDLPALYHEAKIFVFPSLYEGFGLPPLEALSVGTRVISSDAASLPEILGDNVLYFRSDDKEDLKKKIMDAVSDENLLYEESKGEELIAKYNWRLSGEKLFEHLLDSIADK